MSERGPRTLLILALLAPALLLAGCAENPSPLGDAEAAHAGITCPAGTSVVAFNAIGAPECAAPRADPAAPNPLAGFDCPFGQFVTGFDAEGKPKCGSGVLVHRETGKEAATQEVSSNLKVAGIYGVRNNSSEKLWDLKVNVELSAGATPMDLTKLVIRYSDGSTTRNYDHSPKPLPDAYVGSTSFNATWIRGEGAGFQMRSGDLVQLHFNLHDGTLGTRTPVEVSLIPDTGPAVPADFKTPPTYSTYTVVTLR